MRIKNPILPGFNPDPSILRVEDTFYIATSTFEYFPGVNIYESKDLANWQLVCRPCDDTSKLDMRGMLPSTGVWAPCLSYNPRLKKYFVVYSNQHTWRPNPFTDYNNYIIVADDIRGPWSKPTYVNSSGFDASLFHDDNGKVYYMNMEWDHRQLGPKIFSGILMGEIDPNTLVLKEPLRKIFLGTELGVVEAPHIFKKDNYYYLVTAEGGTDLPHAVTIARSKCIYGPYELHPYKQILTAYKTDCYLQKAGHGSFCDDQLGNWYLAHLCSRPLDNGRCILGRETAIQNIIWEDGWPYIIGKGTKPFDYFDTPFENEQDTQKEFIYDFKDLSFLTDLQTIRIPFDNEHYRLVDGGIAITGKDGIYSIIDQSALLRRQTDFAFEATTALTFKPTYFKHMAGLLYRYDEFNQFYLYMSYDEKLKSNVINLFKVDRAAYEFIKRDIPVKEDTIYFKVVVNKKEGQFFYSTNGKDYIEVGSKQDVSILSDDYSYGFTGAFVGIACQDLSEHKKTALFHSFTYKVIQ